jgi:signal peptidase II
MIISGALGNMVDRLFRGYVIDFFDFRLIHFAIFNVADSLISVGAVIFCYYMLFDKELFKG